MSLAKYEIFSKVVELGSLTKAGKVLGISQSAISHAIANLEKEFGFTLFTRSRAGINLSPNGERLLQYVDQIMRINEKMKQEVADIHGIDFGVVKIACVQDIAEKWLPGILVKFIDQYPSIKVKVIVSETKDIYELLQTDEVDFGFTFLENRTDFESIGLLENKLYIVGTYGDSLYNKKLYLPKSFECEAIQSFIENNQISVMKEIVLENTNAILEMIKFKLCTAILPELIVKDLPSSFSRKEIYEETPQMIGITAKSTKNLSSAAEKFVAISSLWVNQRF
ncbi:MAG: hypothetical protein K0R71_352 [Bacillales bacterium]|jgi:DNA-binding transcriptional LysR family regulator|nr:hypothetical protein [Bacillales bacterium]